MRMKETDANLENRFGDHKWSNEDLDPVALVNVYLQSHCPITNVYYVALSDEIGGELALSTNTIN